MNWSDDLSVGVSEIDEQHKKLVAQINTLHDAMRSGQGKDVLEKILGELAAYTQYHFTAEEEYMQKFGYPAYAPHKKEHVAFVTKIATFQEAYAAEKLGLSIEVMTFLRDWVAGHIRGSDTHYTACFREHGLA
ncbi:bacteriohemerythrin [Methanofollis ethanolicus]|uniref:bacteriohemerythrin n=1 Tax=Methanofollis ethanolicus TaxID=488124 RepID=UPI001F1BB3F1|nr:bacteriohemerythrin [Methanofollis ethanolicus]